MTAVLKDNHTTKSWVISWMLLAATIGLLGLLLYQESRGCNFILDPAQSVPTFAYGLLVVPFSGLAYALLGRLVIAHRPANRLGWIMLLFGLFVMLNLLGFSLGNCMVRGGIDFAFGGEIFWLSEIPGQLIGVTGFLLMFMLIPNGRFLTPAWRRAALLMIALLAGAMLLRGFTPGLLNQTMGTVIVENPFGLEILRGTGLREAGGLAFGLLLPIAFFVAILSLLVRWRKSAGETRQQMKWIAYFAATAGLLFIIVEIIGATVYPAIYETWFYLLVLTTFWVGLPVVISLAVLKFRLYDIDIIIHRTLLYSLVTAVLVAVYFILVLLAQSAFVAVTGEESPIAIVISTLVIAALFNPLRGRIQAFINRRFYRRNYDAAQALAQFAQAARDEVEMERLLADLTGVINETMRPESLSLWLNAESRSWTQEA